MVSYDMTKTPVVNVVDDILAYGATHGTSDIHFDHTDSTLKVRIRVDGILNDYADIPNEVKNNVITRIKILSGMNITETRLPQDGGIKTNLGGMDLDMRVSSLPTKKGEKIVIRILDYSRSLKGIEYLFFSEDNYKKIMKMIGAPNGIILVTGATGSGKSTTVYSFLQKLNVKGANLITVEDPVEMEIEGINQVQINSDIGLDFATVLRSILRQDPNIIMIGEIRDTETAQIAVRASITGHLVLSTLHTNSSLTTCLSGGYNINKPSKTGYSFKGYYTSTNGSGTNYVNSSGTFINNAYKTIGDKTLYANWQANTYTITYNANGGSGAPSSQSYTYDPNNDTVFYLSSTTPSRSGYTFLGWSLSSTATSASYSAGQRWGTHNANNYTLYAVWKKTVTVCGENGHVWKTRGIKIISTRFTWTCTRGENHTTAYIIYCSKCGMSALYYEDHYSGSAGATLMCPTHPYDIGSSEVDKVVDDCSLSSYSDAKKVSGGSNSFESTNKRSC